tara:strand:+ start:289 stop:861 length:573 start_codon:yes stop_codon:yes gene_type:complete
MATLFEYILEIDEIILEFINIKLSNSFFDFLMPIFDKPIGFILPVLVFWIFSILKNSSKRMSLILLIPLVIAFTDQIGFKIKKFEFRERPWVQNKQINHLGGNGGKQFSFPSNHAANSMAIATTFINILGQRYLVLLFLAFVTGYSRIYIGVHYPGDILAGFLLGWIVARLLILATDKIKFNWVKYRQAN